MFFNGKPRLEIDGVVIAEVTTAGRFQLTDPVGREAIKHPATALIIANWILDTFGEKEAP